MGSTPWKKRDGFLGMWFFSWNTSYIRIWSKSAAILITIDCTRSSKIWESCLCKSCSPGSLWKVSALLTELAVVALGTATPKTPVRAVLKLDRKGIVTNDRRSADSFTNLFVKRCTWLSCKLSLVLWYRFHWYQYFTDEGFKINENVLNS